jgi:hypothetical protein
MNYYGNKRIWWFNPSQDPKWKCLTASVRFNIGMDDTGGDGRLRTRARYLVPNNQ